MLRLLSHGMALYLVPCKRATESPCCNAGLPLAPRLKCDPYTSLPYSMCVRFCEDENPTDIRDRSSDDSRCHLHEGNLPHQPCQQNIRVSWDVMLHHWDYGSWHFKESQWLYHQGQIVQEYLYCCTVHFVVYLSKTPKNAHIKSLIS